MPVCVQIQIAGLLKDNEKIQSNPEVPPSDDDTEIKKIKKVRSDCFDAVQFDKRIKKNLCSSSHVKGKTK